MAGGAERDVLDVLVLGGGISGLAAAFWLARAGREVELLEASGRVGGAIASREVEGPDGRYLFELGANTVLATDPAVSEILRDAGLDDERLEAARAGARRWIWHGGRLIPLPMSPPQLLATPLLPWSGKLRLLGEPWIGRGPASRPEGAGRRGRAGEAAEGESAHAPGEETVADFVRRRLGRAVLERAVAPFVSGVYAGDPERLSVRWALPALHALERDHGSLLRGALASRKSRSGGGERRPAAMLSFPGGLSTLPRRLAASEELSGRVRLETPAESLSREGDGWVVGTPGGSLRARRVIVTLPAKVSALLLAGVSDGGSDLFTEVPHAPVAVVGMGVRGEDVSHPLDGFGFLAARGQGVRILGCLFGASLFPGRAPEGHATLTSFLGGATDPELPSADDATLLATTRADLERTLGLTAEPRVTVVHRWSPGLPQPELGHHRFVERARRIENASPGLHLATSWLGGTAVPDRIRDARRVVCEILEC